MQVSPALAKQTAYPFVRLDEAKARIAAEGVRVLDFGMGEPRGLPEESIRRELAAALDEANGYPRAAGVPELRAAIASWCGRRFGIELDAANEVIPTYGSKEAIFSFAQLVVDETRGKDLVLVTEPGYPVYERGAQFARARVGYLPIGPTGAFLPDLEAVDAELWSRCALVWVNYPNNPTGAVAPLEFYEQLARLADEHAFLIGSDEAYSEIWFDEEPASALQVSDRRRVVVFNSLSKRSSMPGYRSGFVAASEDVVAALRKYRPTVGTAPQEFLQRASVVAWSDEEHVQRIRAGYRRKRDLFLGLCARKHLRAHGAATMFLWIETPDGESSEQFAERLLRLGVVVAPGSYLGPSGEGYVRLALVPSDEECRIAVELLDAEL
jgi:succinyldiaminopimelate transaminase